MCSGAPWANESDLLMCLLLASSSSEMSVIFENLDLGGSSLWRKEGSSLSTLLVEGVLQSLHGPQGMQAVHN